MSTVKSSTDKSVSKDVQYYAKQLDLGLISIDEVPSNMRTNLSKLALDSLKKTNTKKEGKDGMFKKEFQNGSIRTKKRKELLSLALSFEGATTPTEQKKVAQNALKFIQATYDINLLESLPYRTNLDWRKVQFILPMVKFIRTNNLIK